MKIPTDVFGVVTKCKPGRHSWASYKPEIIPAEDDTFDTETYRVQCTRCGSVKGRLKPDPQPEHYPPGTFNWVD